jgi:hypothetical protein
MARLSNLGTKMTKTQTNMTEEQVYDFLDLLDYAVDSIERAKTLPATAAPDLAQAIKRLAEALALTTLQETK